MKQQDTKQQQQAFRYFLGELSENEQSAVEERFFGDETYSRFLDEAENRLVELYAAGKLDLKQKKNFENHFLISERRREMLHTALVLQNEVSSERKNIIFLSPQDYLRQFWGRFSFVSNLAWATSFAAIAIFIALSVFWQQKKLLERSLTAQIETRSEIAAESPKSFSPSTGEQKDAVQKQSVSHEKLSLPVTKFHAPHRGKSSAAPSSAKSKLISPTPITLLPPVMNAEKQLVVSTRAAATENIRLRVVHNNEQNFVKYLVEIHASDGDLIWSREIAVNDKTLQKPLALAVRGGALTDGRYGLTVSGATSDGQLEEVNNYNFTFRKK